jgi:hypothetical protein
MLLTAYALDGISVSGKIAEMTWDVKLDAAFAAEAAGFSEAVRIEIAALGNLLRAYDPQLRRPHCDTLNGSQHSNMKELRLLLTRNVKPSCWSGAASRE